MTMVVGVPPGSAVGVAGFTSLCEDCLSVSKNYGRPDEMIRRWCGLCAKAHGGVAIGKLNAKLKAQANATIGSSAIQVKTSVPKRGSGQIAASTGMQKTLQPSQVRSTNNSTGQPKSLHYIAARGDLLGSLIRGIFCAGAGAAGGSF